MNGHTHAICGAASTFSTTLLLIRFEPEVSSCLPDFLLPLFHPPAWFFAIPLPFELLAQTTLGTGSVGDGIVQGPEKLNQVWSFISVVGLPLLLVLFIGWVVGQLPDIDEPHSSIANSGNKLGRLFGGGGGFLFGLVSLIFSLLNIIPQILAFCANRFFGGHRNGIVHGLVGLLGGSLLVGGISQLLWGQPFYGLLFFVAFISHLILDSLTEMGIRWLWPFSKESYHFLSKSFRLHSDSSFSNLALQQLVLLPALLGNFFLLFGR